MKEISVVMSVYKNDKPDFFRKAVESIVNQTYPSSEIIIVVDGEVKKELLDVLNEFSSHSLVRVIKLKENKGLANALNVGIKLSKYDLIARMDSDDIAFKDRFYNQIKVMDQYGLDIVGGQMIEFGENEEDIISYRKVPIDHEEIGSFIKLRAPFSHPTILFKKEIFTKLNGYDTNIFPEDYDFFVRVYMNGYKMGNVKENVLWFRLGNNYSEAIKRRWGKEYAQNEFKLYKKFYKIGFYSYGEFIKTVLLKIPLRLLPFRLFKFIYFKISR